MNHSANADVVKLGVVRYKIPADRTLELGNSVRVEEESVTKTSGFGEFSV